MAINFPDSPTNGQVFTSGSQSWTYYTTPGVWKVTSGAIGYTGSKGTTFIGDTAPASSLNGDTWFDSEEGIRYVYYVDGTSSQWIQESIIGPTGSTGYTGSIGYTGSQGYTGSASTVIGYTGSQGPTVYPSSGIAVSNGSGWTTSKTSPTGDIVGTTDTQALTNKTLQLPTITDYVETAFIVNSGSTLTISLTAGTVQIVTLTASCTFTFPSTTAGKSFMMILKQDGIGSRTVTWPASVKWPGSTAPTITATANKGDKFVFTADGTYWWGSTAGQNYL